jgi:serine-type D-Ala-D-Ala carboxypeptidase/endopeptidase
MEPIMNFKSLRFPSLSLLLALSLPVISLAQPAPAQAARQEISVAQDVLAQYVGNYQLAPNVFFMVTLANGQLVSQVTGQQQVPLFAESETVFFPKVVEATIEFKKDAAGAVTGLVLNQNGRSISASRFTGELPAAPVHNEITLAPEVLGRYVGNYTFPQGFTIAVTLENGQLMEQLGTQPKFPIFPETETRFFLKVVEATMDFQMNDAGAVTGVTLNQNGNSTTGTKQ